MRSVLSLSFVLSAAALNAAPAKEVTFYKDVLPVLQQRCQECHRPGEAAPMAFRTYKETRPWAKAIREAVAAGKMPPWFADAAHGSFSNDRRLSDREKQTLTAWADTGAKEGDAKDAPPAVAYTEGWSIGTPDVVLEMPKPFKVPAKGTVDYTWVVVPTGFKEDRWVEKIEVRPGDKSVVHHVVMFSRAPGSKYMKDAKPGEPYTPPHEAEVPADKRKPDQGQGAFYMLGGSVEMVSVYVPGGVAYNTRPGQARLIKAGSDMIFQMHYTASGKETLDQSKVGLVFAKEPPKERVINTFVLNPDMHIPPMAGNHKVVARVTLQDAAELQALFPHMHVRGKSFEYKAIYPTGESEVLLSVPKYDFNWQLSYYLAQNKKLPKGTVIECSAWYDNSPNNPSNPDPKADVYWGEQTWEEMLAGFIDFVIPASKDPLDLSRPKKQPAVQASLQ